MSGSRHEAAKESNLDGSRPMSRARSSACSGWLLVDETRRGDRTVRRFSVFDYVGNAGRGSPTVAPGGRRCPPRRSADRRGTGKGLRSRSSPNLAEIALSSVKLSQSCSAEAIEATSAREVAAGPTYVFTENRSMTRHETAQARLLPPGAFYDGEVGS